MDDDVLARCSAGCGHGSLVNLSTRGTLPSWISDSTTEMITETINQERNVVCSTVDASVREQYSDPTVHAAVDSKHVTVQHTNISERVTLQHDNITEHVTPLTGEHCVSRLLLTQPAGLAEFCTGSVSCTPLTGEHCMSRLLLTQLAGLAEFCTGSMLEQYCPRIRIGIDYKLMDSQLVPVDTIAVLRTLNCDVTVMISGDVSKTTHSPSVRSPTYSTSTHTHNPHTHNSASPS